ncbi:MAG: LVIVD repeat-containing protein [Actinomycetota bacterium]
MKRLLTIALATSLAFGMVPAAGAGIDLNQAGPSQGGISSDNVEWIKHIPFSGPSGSGGRLVGRYFYALDATKLTIYDTKDPLNPELVGMLENPHEPIFSREDVDTNGRILLMPNLAYAPGPLHIVDVEDKTNPTIIASVPNTSEHTFSCILDCKWAYGSEGGIIDLRDPANPVKAEEKWGDGTPSGSNAHDVTEVSPGIVLTATPTIMLLDARKNPKKPKLLASGSTIDMRFQHTAVWPNQGKDRWILMAGETNFQPRCSDTRGAFMTFDSKNWKKTRTFKMVDEYRVSNGTYVDGQPAVNAIGCSSHWHEERPTFKNGGHVAAAFFEHGTRFLDIKKDGKVEEIGWFVPHLGSTGAVYWRTKDIVYTTDYTRGIDILKFND